MDKCINNIPGSVRTLTKIDFLLFLTQKTHQTGESE